MRPIRASRSITGGCGLVERKYRATPDAKPELSCRIEHDGAGCYFPLGTLNEAQAAERALEDL